MRLPPPPQAASDVEDLKLVLLHDEGERQKAEAACDAMMEDLQREAFEGKRESDIVAATRLKCEVGGCARSAAPCAGH